MKQEMFKIENNDVYRFVSASAYDTAWLGMVPDSNVPFGPMFKGCLNWVLNNQTRGGFWGDSDVYGNPTIESLPATLACLVLLRRWNSGKSLVDKAISFIHANVEKLLEENEGQYPPWFVIVFPAMVDLSLAVGLNILFPHSSQEPIAKIVLQRQQILQSEGYPPLMSYLEALTPSDNITEDDIIRNLSEDGSLFQSPSATARAFMLTGNQKCLAYLQSLVQNCGNGVPATYPMDEDLIKLSLVNQLQKLGLSDHFVPQIDDVLAQVYRNYKKEEAEPNKPNKSLATKLHKDSLAFKMLRMHGYRVSPRTFCWFLNDQEFQQQIKNNPEHFSTVMLNVYRATDIMFPDEHEPQEARQFAKKVLENITCDGDKSSSPFRKLIGHELAFPWMTRMEQLEHRMWIEDKNVDALWMGKTSFHRLSNYYNERLMKLASQNYESRQSIYRNELEELKRWSEEEGLSEMGFGREKTTYCYFAVAASTSLPHNSHIRLLVSKGAILITVADDFFDEIGSLSQLTDLTTAVQKWDKTGLEGHGKKIFEALANYVKEVADQHLQLHGSDITVNLKNIWYETFASWLMEAKTSKTGSKESIDEYLETGMVSIAAHTLVLPASCFLTPGLPNHQLKPAEYETVTKLLMLLTRLLNEVQSYQKEEEAGKINLVLLHKRENPEAEIKDSIAYVKQIISTKEKELLQHVLMEGFSNLPKNSRHLHLSCLKVFQMFFNSSNRYDSNTSMLLDIQKAIYLPLHVNNVPKQEQKHIPIPVPVPEPNKKYQTTVKASMVDINLDLSSFKTRTRKTFIGHKTNLFGLRNNKITVSPKFHFSFI